MSTIRDKKKQITCDNSHTRLLPVSLKLIPEDPSQKKKKDVLSPFLPSASPIKVRSSEFRRRRDPSWTAVNEDGGQFYTFEAERRYG